MTNQFSIRMINSKFITLIKNKGHTNNCSLEFVENTKKIEINNEL